MHAKKGLGFFLGLVLANAAAAQNFLPLDSVSVTASVHAQNTARSGRNIQTIAGTAFGKLPVNSIDELLRYVPGIEVQSRGGMGSQSDILIRGGTFQQVLVLIDGIRVNDPITGHFNAYIPIAPAEIERIEVLKGPAAAIWGSEAVGGVVHVITKNATARRGERKLSGGATMALGSYGSLRTDGGAHFSNGKISFGGGFYTALSDGHRQRGTRGDFHNQTVSLSAGAWIGKAWRITTRSAWDDRRFSAQNFYTTFLSDTARERVASFWHSASAQRQTDKSSLTISAGYRGSDDNYRFNRASSPNLNKSQLWQGMVHHTARLRTATQLHLGAQFFNRTIKSNDRGNHTVNHVAGFASLSHTTAGGFTLHPALRADWTGSRGLEWVPQLALAYNRDRLTLRGTVGKTVRDADFTERYNNYQKTLVTAGRIGNPDLDAEISTSYELGADYRPHPRLRLSGTFFHRRGKGIIDYVTTPYAEIPRNVNLVPTGNYAFAKNVAEVSSAGGEMDLSYVQSLGRGWQITTQAGLLYVDITDQSGSDAIYLTAHARWLVNGFFLLESNRFRLSSTLLYKTRNRQAATSINAQLSSSYFTLGSRAEILFLNKRLGFFVQGDNVTDEDFSDILGARMPGAWWQGGARFGL